MTQTATERALNFSAGPATLPEPVLKQARKDIWDIEESGIGICEHSHRGPVFDNVINEAVADCREVGSIPDEFEILFMQGGATLQFAMLAMNFLKAGTVADYLDTGVWTSKAIKEAKKIGSVNVAFDGSVTNHDHCPSDDELHLSQDAAYLHYCSNNTIYGTRYEHVPTTNAPVICDMSSDIFSRAIDWSKHSMVYAGAQKNLGPSGTVLVVIKKSLLEQCDGSLPLMLDYKAQASKGSMLNTPPTFGIYLMGQVFKWILNAGGLSAIEQRNEAKAAVIYDALQGCNGFYSLIAREDCRSRMNISFRCQTPELDAIFLETAAAHRMSGLKGHRSVGGLRASVYNAFPFEGCEKFAEFLTDFADNNG
ncbi:MAG: phosphoserine transaminase [Planctomycetes bacterium]|nr:phosphoserine transaminase [Planctomycetota bacterium]